MSSKEYNFEFAESFVQNLWTKRKTFQTINGDIANKFVISLPPPNVTGRLHMGHALNNTLQDFFVRYKRMSGYQSLWLSGTDHAGIATQSVVTRFLDAQGIDLKKLSKEKFLEHIWTWKEKYGNTIYQQMQRIGCSCDFSKSRFTMDAAFSRAVLFAFDRLYKDGLIYRGNRIVNWCPVDKTALSDDEVERKEGGEPGFLWSILYKFPGSEEGLVVATTRPETLFGDVAVAVHPEDLRYVQYIGQSVLIPILQKKIPIIGDSYVERDFGTGCLKITPGHDANDFLIGNRHKLSPINIMHEDATMNENVPLAYRGLSRESCRKKVIQELENSKQLIFQEKRNIPVARSYRSGAIIEYRLSNQWFIKTKPLVDKLLPKLDQLKFIPSCWGAVHLRWLESMNDWCISRQIVWGHRIPAWIHVKTGRILVDQTVPQEVLKSPDEWQQETDVLDTWFSSALWPMANLGWPEKTPDFQQFFPNQMIFTAKDIIFFWIARMCLFSSYFEDKLPFQKVFVHPTISDEKGQRMSKTKGNGIDPIHVIQGASLKELESVVLDANPPNTKQILFELRKKYPQGVQGVGADALRFTLMKLCSSNQDIKLSFQDFTSIGRRFITKIWNASRLILEKLDGVESFNLVNSKECLINKDICVDWILCMYHKWVNKIHEAVEDKNYQAMDFINLANVHYNFIWNHLCDWFLEISKIKLKEPDKNNQKLYAETLLYLLDGSLRCLHPVIPFITEYIWNDLQEFLKKKKILHKDVELARNNFPSFVNDGAFFAKETGFCVIIDVVSRLRSMRSDYGLGKQIINGYFFTNENFIRKVLLSQKPVIEGLTKICLSDLTQKEDINEKWFPLMLNTDYQVYIDLQGKLDLSSQIDKLEKDMKLLVSEMQTVSSYLSDTNFVARAPQNLVQEREERMSFLQSRQIELDKRLIFLKSL